MYKTIRQECAVQYVQKKKMLFLPITFLKVVEESFFCPRFFKSCEECNKTTFALCVSTKSVLISK